MSTIDKNQVVEDQIQIPTETPKDGPCPLDWP